jgi:hypothetical protein
MKKKLLIIALIAIIGFSFAACDDSGDSKDNDYFKDDSRWVISEQTTYAVEDGIVQDYKKSKTSYKWIAYRYTNETNYEEKYMTYYNNKTNNNYNDHDITTDNESYSVYHYTRNGKSSNSTTETISRTTKTDKYRSDGTYYSDVLYNASSGNSSITSSYDLESGFTASATSVAPGGVTTLTIYSIELLSDTGEIKTYKYYPVGSKGYSIYKIKNGKTLETGYYDENNSLLYTTIYTQPDNAEIRAKLPNFTLHNTTYYSSSYSINSSNQTVEVIGEGNTYDELWRTYQYFIISVKQFNDGVLSSQTDYKYIKKDFNADKYDLGIWFEYIYREVNGEIDIYRYMGIENYTNIPTWINGKPVTTIGQEAFKDCTSLINITIPSVTKIENNAFSNCKNLISVTIHGGNVTSINAFSRCSNLASITLGSGVIGNIEDICYIFSNPSPFGGGFANLIEINVDSGNPAYSSEDGVLYNKNKTTLISCPQGKAGAFTIGNGVTEIFVYAFTYCRSLTSINIPKSVTSIINSAFDYCDSLTAINVDAGNNVYTSQDGILYTKGKNVLSRYPPGKTGSSFIIPNSVNFIWNGAFATCYNLTSITIPNSVTEIQRYAFRGCNNITSVTFQGKISSDKFDQGAFDYGEDLRQKYLAGGVGTYTRPDVSSNTWTKQPY